MSLYLSGNWYKQLLGDKTDCQVSLRDDLINRGIDVYDWTVFSNMNRCDNAVQAVDAIRSCSVYAAVFDAPDHRYAGTFELLGMALALGKRVLIYVDVPVVNVEPDIRGGKRWGTSFDRFLLYHPSIELYVQGQFKEFCQDLVLACL